MESDFSSRKIWHWKTHFLQVLQKCDESKGHIVLLITTIGTSASLHDNGQKLHTLLGLGVGEKSSNEPSASNCSKYGPHSDGAEFLGKSSLTITDKGECTLFKMLHVMLKELRFQSGESSSPRSDDICKKLSGDYLQLLRVVPSLNWYKTNPEMSTMLAIICSTSFHRLQIFGSTSKSSD